MRFVALSAVALLVACGGSRRRQTVAYSPQPAYAPQPAARPPSMLQRLADWTGVSNHLPRRADGSFSLLEIAGSRLEINPSLHDPLTALGACADLVTGCYGPTMPLDRCVAGARACTTAQPWNESACCPVACQQRFAQQRQAGRAPLDAFENVFFTEPNCFPGVQAMVVRAP
jgi:hypothetical protein